MSRGRDGKDTVYEHTLNTSSLPILILAFISFVDGWFGDGDKRIRGYLGSHGDDKMVEIGKRNDSVVEKMKVPYQGRDDHSGD